MSHAQFFWLGAQQVLLAVPLLLCLVGLLLLARSGRIAWQLVGTLCAFLALAMVSGSLGGLAVPAAIIDVANATSVAFVGGIVLTKMRLNRLVQLVLAAVFGIFQGLGFASRFSELVISAGLETKVALYAAGVGFGLAALIAVVAGLGIASGLDDPGRRLALNVPAGLTLIGGAILAFSAAMYLALFPTMGDTVELTLPRDSACQIEPNTDPLEVGTAGTVPLRGFWPPGEVTPAQVFTHARADGFLTIVFPRDADPSVLTALKELSESPEGKGVLIGTGMETLKTYRLTTYHEVMECESFDEQTMRKFIDAWFLTL